MLFEGKPTSREKPLSAGVRFAKAPETLSVNFRDPLRQMITTLLFMSSFLFFSIEVFSVLKGNPSVIHFFSVVEKKEIRTIMYDHLLPFTCTLRASILQPESLRTLFANSMSPAPYFFSPLTFHLILFIHS